MALVQTRLTEIIHCSKSGMFTVFEMQNKICCHIHTHGQNIKNEDDKMGERKGKVEY